MWISKKDYDTRKNFRYHALVVTVATNFMSGKTSSLEVLDKDKETNFKRAMVNILNPQSSYFSQGSSSTFGTHTRSSLTPGNFEEAESS